MFVRVCGILSCLAMLVSGCQTAATHPTLVAGGNPDCQATARTPQLDAVVIEATDDVFTPSCSLVSTEDVLRLVVRNVGRRPHTFTVDAQGIDLHLDAGQVAFVDVDVTEVRIVYRCTLHAGMTGVLEHVQ